MSQALQRHQAGAVRPNLEPVTVARKPLTGTVAENVQTYGTGALNIDGCRVGRDADDVSGWSQTGSKASENRAMSGGNYARDAKPDAEGRWPANLIHDGGDEAAGLLGEAARFFYCPKASKRDRDEGLEDMERKASGMVPNTSGKHITRRDEGYEVAPRANNHPTVKPTELMRYLCRLVTPPGGVVLDPFMGSGSTGKGAMLEGFRFLGIEREAQYVEIAKARIASAEDKASQPRQATLFQEA
jgi:site-specific DNA-methyltransferase (adenine-specific)